jgi:hypothetical protein
MVLKACGLLFQLFYLGANGLGSSVSAAEAASNTTQQERGLAFVAYQSQIANGFQFQQVNWVNNPGSVLIFLLMK